MTRARCAPQLVFGNESTGISGAMSALGDGDFTIPMTGLTESFNVSVAAAICVHWGRHAREAALGRATDLSDAAAAELLSEYTSAAKHYEHHIRVTSPHAGRACGAASPFARALAHALRVRTAYAGGAGRARCEPGGAAPVPARWCEAAAGD